MRTYTVEYKLWGWSKPQRMEVQARNKSWAETKALFAIREEHGERTVPGYVNAVSVEYANGGYREF